MECERFGRKDGIPRERGEIDDPHFRSEILLRTFSDASEGEKSCPVGGKREVPEGEVIGEDELCPAVPDDGKPGPSSVYVSLSVEVEAPFLDILPVLLLFASRLQLVLLKALESSVDRKECGEAALGEGYESAYFPVNRQICFRFSSVEGKGIYRGGVTALPFLVAALCKEIESSPVGNAEAGLSVCRERPCTAGAERVEVAFVAFSVFRSPAYPEEDAVLTCRERGEITVAQEILEFDSVHGINYKKVKRKDKTSLEEGKYPSRVFSWNIKYQVGESYYCKEIFVYLLMPGDSEKGKKKEPFQVRSLLFFLNSSWLKEIR